MAITIWFTGLPCSGKSTLADTLRRDLESRGLRCALLDGDDLRRGLCADLTFSATDRVENIRRAAEVARLLLQHVDVVLATFVSPLRSHRNQARTVIGPDQFVEVFVDCPVDVCEQRDVKGMYRRAREGQIENFTGIHAPYETPEGGAIVIPTHQRSIEESLDELKLRLAPHFQKV